MDKLNYSFILLSINENNIIIIYNVNYNINNNI